MLTGRIHGSGKGFENAFNNMVGFFPVEKFQVQIAPAFIGKTLEKFARQAEPESGRHVLLLFQFRYFIRKLVQAAPHQVGTTAEIDQSIG